MVEGWYVHFGWLFRVQGSHNIDLNLSEDATTTLEDIFINIFLLRLETVDLCQTESVDPELLQISFIQVTQCYLLKAQDVEGSLITFMKVNITEKNLMVDMEVKGDFFTKWFISLFDSIF